MALLIAIASATQDITVDALRIEQIGENEGKSMAAGAAMAVVGWWTGYKLGGVLSLFSAEYLQNLGFENYWQLTFLILGVAGNSNEYWANVCYEESDSKIEKIKQKENDKLISNKILRAKI